MLDHEIKNACMHTYIQTDTRTHTYMRMSYAAQESNGMNLEQKFTSWPGNHCRLKNIKLVGK